jgi:tyrosinase
LDWEDLRSASIWSSNLGFGGDGEPDGPETVGHGRCVTTGPFADVKALIYASHDQPHCLSRGFSNFSGWDARPAAVEHLLNVNEYEKFFLAVENGPHNVVPRTVRGDFWSFTAPYGESNAAFVSLYQICGWFYSNTCSPIDPVFFLHHAQLDRLWWMWQQRGLPRRLTEYHGPASANATVGATIQDLLLFRGISEYIPVSYIMDTEGGHLCYRY